MVTVFLIAYLLWRANDLINVVLFSGLIVLAINPLNLFDIGFQLSYAAVLSLILIMPLVQEWVHQWIWKKSIRPSGRLKRSWLWTKEAVVFAIILSIAAILGTWLITGDYFNYLSVVSIPANALVVPLVVPLTAAGIAALALGYVWIPLGYIAALPCKGMLALMLGIVTKLGGFPWSALSVHSPPRWLIILYYSALLVALEYFHQKYPPLKRKSDNI